MRRPVTTVLLGLLCLAATALGADDVLRTYKSRFGRGDHISSSERVVRELGETGHPKALDALEWCLEEVHDRIDDALDDLEDAQDELRPLQIERDEKQQKYIDQLKKQGKPIKKTRPKWHIDLEVEEAEGVVVRAEKDLADWRGMLPQVKKAYSDVLVRLPEDDLAKERAGWERGALASRDWAERALRWELIGGVEAGWATDMLLEATNAEPEPRVLVHILDGLAGRAPEDVTGALVAALSDVRWLVRTAAVGALEKTPSKEAVDRLVALLGTGEGRVLDDAARALSTLTGETFGTNAAQWRNWWAGARAEWTGPPEPEPDAGADAGPGGDEGIDRNAPPEEPKVDETDARRTGFFGIDTRSKRRVYVIDVSGSMNERSGEVTRAEAAKEELKRSIAALEDGALFNVVFFSNEVRIWQEDMVEAGSETRGEALEYIDGVTVAGGTNTFDGLLAAFDLGDVGRGKKRGEDPDGDSKVDTIILLSDGMPSVGTLTDPDGIRRAIAELNHTRRIAIHTVAFGKDADTEFLAGLAEESGGTSVAK